MIKLFRLGFASGNSNDLALFRERDNIEHARHLGLLSVSKKDEDMGEYSYFRNRVMFPLFDLAGNVLGFTGRDVSGNPKTKAKYLNSKETDIFQKSIILHGYFQSYFRIVKQGYVIIVEGNVDVIRMYERNYPVVGLSGHFMSQFQADILRRTYPKMFLMMDGDKAGKSGAISITTIFRKINDNGIRVRLPRLIELPHGYDPDTFMLKYPEPEDYVNEKMFTDSFAEWEKRKFIPKAVLQKYKEGRPSIAELRDRLNIIDVIGRRVQLSRVGANYRCKCPFHDEKTASFTVSEARQMFKCFGCGVGGDVFSFVMKFHEVGFGQAIKILTGEL